jgi:hypothetical protein
MISYLIWLACLQASVPGQPQFNQACLSGLKAASIMSGVDEKDKLALSKLQSYARSIVPNDLGAAAAIVYEVAVKRQVTMKLGSTRLYDDLALTGSETMVGISITWHF